MAGQTRKGDKKDNRAIFMDFNQRPYDIVRVMDDAVVEAAQYQADKRRVRIGLLLLFPLGVIFLLIDFLMGYNLCSFSLVTVTVWAAALVGLNMLGRKAAAPQFDSRFDQARTIFDTLKDDVAPKRTMIGWLDLTGYDQKGKLFRQKKSPSGRPVEYFRDEWLRVKMRLYDGSVLRFSLIERVKVRRGFYKRGRISGKQKWKPGSTDHRHLLQLSISPAPGEYQLDPMAAPGQPIPGTSYGIGDGSLTDERVVLKALTADRDASAEQVLAVLQYGYGHLQPVKDVMA